MGVSNIVLGTNNLTQNGNNLDVTMHPPPYNKLYLNIGGQDLVGKKIALNKINLVYSWPNISTTNNTFSLSWPVGAGFTTINVAIPPYSDYDSIDSLNSYLQTVMIDNGMYFINSSNGNYLYYLQMISNNNLYGVSLVLNQIPTSLPAGYTAPIGFAGFPSVSKTMRFTTNTSDFNLLIGYPKSTVFDGGTSNIVFNSQYVPMLSPVSSVNVTCNLASNTLALNNDSSIIFCGTSIGTKFGSMINWEPSNLIYYDITSTSNTLIVTFTDQDFNPLYILDPAISVFFIVID